MNRGGTVFGTRGSNIGGNLRDGRGPGGSADPGGSLGAEETLQIVHVCKVFRLSHVVSKMMERYTNITCNALLLLLNFLLRFLRTPEPTPRLLVPRLPPPVNDEQQSNHTPFPTNDIKQQT